MHLSSFTPSPFFKTHILQKVPSSKQYVFRAGAFFIMALSTISLNHAVAQNLKDKPTLTEIGWLEDERDYVEHLSTKKPLCLTAPENKDVAALMDIGSVAFRSPLLFGGLAARKKISCDSCHQNGDVNDEFFIKGLSDRPGHIDATNAIFSKTLEDNIYNPIPIPTLYGINDKDSFGTLSPVATKAQFVRRVIEDEFDGPKPDQRIFDGLMAYINHFDNSCASNTTFAGQEEGNFANAPALRSVEADFNHIIKAINIAEHEWKNGRTDIADFILISARHELGLIYERYNRQSLKKPTKGLLSLSNRLEKVRSNIKPVLISQKPLSEEKVQKQFTRWQTEAKRLTTHLNRDQPRSYYNAEQLSELLKQ